MKKFDEGLARGEGAIAAVVLISMIVVASIQALLRNLTYLDLAWANDALGSIDWADQFLKKGTLWLAFLGASLATRDERHIAIDVLPKLLSDRGKLIVKGLVGVFTSVIAFMLARAFWSAVLVNALERPMTYEVFGDSGPIHSCEATAEQLEQARLAATPIFCGVRGLLASLGAPVETPQAALQLIVPAAFVIMSVRLFANGIGAFMDLGKPIKHVEEPNAIAKAAMVADHDHVAEKLHAEHHTAAEEAANEAKDDEKEAPAKDEKSDEKGEA